MWFWVVGGLVVWLLAAVALAAVVGRGIRLADLRSPGMPIDGPLTTADLPQPLQAPAAPRAARRRVPLPPLGIGLAAAAVSLEAVGYAVRLSGATGASARAFSMDAPYSLPRMFVAALFAAAAIAAVTAAGRIPGRRTWWLSVGLVAAFIAAVKTGSTVHSDAMATLGGVVGSAGAVAVSVTLALGVLAVLAFISRAERRDRRRILTTLGFYAVASVGLSAVSTLVVGSPRLAAAATFLEESGEALAGVAFLVGVLVGVAPKLALPAAWALRRSADAHTLEVPEHLPARRRADGTAAG